MLPDAFLFQTSKEPFDYTVLLWCIWSNEFLGQIILTACSTETTALEDQAIIAPDNGRITLRPKSPESVETCLLDGALRLTGSAAKRELASDQLTIAAIYHSGKMSPSVLPAIYVSQVHCPADIALLAAAP
jgi:hypothetical protein